MQFRHAIGARPLEADDHDHVAIQLAGGEGLGHAFLRIEHAARRLDRPAFLLYGAGLESRTAQIALDQPASELTAADISVLY